MIAPIDLKIKNIESVSLEQIINSKEIGKVERVLSNYLNDLEIEKFKESLLKNFSLQSLLENLTILNAPRLLDSVEDFINSLQYYTKIKLNSKTRVGIYIHTCLLVERLVTKNQIEKYDNLDEFIRENSNFINYAKKAFDRILSFYNVEIPISEIAYLYDYIKHNDRESTEENEF